MIQRLRFACLACLIALPLLAATPAPARAQASRFFPETGHTVGGDFLDYWDQHGGLPIFGLPITEEFREIDLTVQYFERARFERHPENNPPYTVLLGLLAADTIPDGAPTGRATPNGSAECTYYAETGHNLCFGFRTYWRAFGGLPNFGYPLTEEFRQRLEDGQVHTVQYFERTRLEWHPGAYPQRFDVLQGRLGVEARVVEVPAVGTRQPLPFHLLARVGQPGQVVTARVRWADGTAFDQPLTALRGEDGRGLVTGDLTFPHEGMPPMPPTQPARLELRDASGALLARRTLTALAVADPDTQLVSLYFPLGDELRAVQRRVTRTPRIGAAALEELLWGPPAPNLAGFDTAIPTPAEVLAFPGRGADWGPRVTLRSLSIANGVATADFSREMLAYGGGSLRVRTIREQITRTLLQFPTIQRVVISVEGDPDALQP